MEFLGRIISVSRVYPDLSKVKRIRQWPVPTSVHDIMVFLGMAGYYYRFIPIYPDKAAVLIDLIKKSKKWEWIITAQESVEQLKFKLSTAFIL